MTSFLDSLKALVQPRPEPTVDESWPQKEDPEYFEDKSVPVIYQPPEGALLDEWRPTADQVVPGYRGTEEHGVPYNAVEQYIVPNTEALNDKEDKTEGEVEYVQEKLVDPIPVTVVELPEPIGVEKRLAVARYDIAPGTTVRIAPKSRLRVDLHLQVLDTTDAVYISRDEQQASSQGYPVIGSSGEIKLDITDAVYGYVESTASDSVRIFVLETYGTSIDEYSV